MNATGAKFFGSAAKRFRISAVDGQHFRAQAAQQRRRGLTATAQAENDDLFVTEFEHLKLFRGAGRLATTANHLIFNVLNATTANSTHKM